jgi:hypothetical protein
MKIHYKEYYQKLYVCEEMIPRNKRVNMKAETFPELICSHDYNFYFLLIFPNIWGFHIFDEPISYFYITIILQCGDDT